MSAEANAAQSDVFGSIVEARYSVRGFKPDPVDDATLRRVFEQAGRAPSNCNTQPWRVALISGSRLRSLCERMTTGMAELSLSMDYPYDGVYDGVFKERQYGAADALYSAQGIERADKAKRNEAFMRNFDCFGAPHAAFLFLPGEFGIREAADLGMYAQTIMLSAVANGLGSCPQTALSFHADLVREEAGFGPENKLLFGISLGYIDDDHPANRCRTDRAAIDQVVTFVGSD